MNNTLLFLILQKQNLFYVSEKETAGQSMKALLGNLQNGAGQFT